MIIFLKTSHLGILIPYFHTAEISSTEHLSLTWWICVKIPMFALHSLHQSLQFKSFPFLQEEKLVLCDLDNQLLDTKISQSSVIIQKS